MTSPNPDNPESTTSSASTSKASTSKTPSPQTSADLCNLFDALLACSQELATLLARQAQGDTALDPARVERLLVQRQALLEQSEALNFDVLTPKDREACSQALAQVHLLEPEIEQQMSRIRALLKEQLQEFHTHKNVLTGYHSPPKPGTPSRNSEA